MGSVIFYSYICAGLGYGFILLKTLLSKQREPLLLMALLASVLWVTIIIRSAGQAVILVTDTFGYESLRNFTWFLYLFSQLSLLQTGHRYQFLRSHFFPVALCLMLVILGLETIDAFRYWLQIYLQTDPRLFIHVLFAVIGLMLIEQLFRNAQSEQRWKLKFLCFGLGGMYAMDLVTYSKSLLFVHLDFLLWQSRGIIYSIMLPMLTVGVQRLALNGKILSTPRKSIFYTTIVFGCGLYLILMALAGYYLRQTNAEWGETAQTVFLFLALVLLVVLFSSGKIRAISKVYFNKFFFHYSYDYRDEWLKLSKALANLTSLEQLKLLSIKSLADLVDSSGGGLWLKHDAGGFYLAEQSNLGISPDQLLNLQQLSADNELADYLVSKRWVIDFIELAHQPETYADINLQTWQRLPNRPVWLIVPLLRADSLEGFVVLTKPRAARRLNWEDHDLLKTVALQLANALALNTVSEQLTRTRQFEAYHQLSAFLVHDLKNLVAQISLLVKNAEKHKANPDFIEDAIATLANVVDKIQHIILQLKQGKPTAEQSKLNLASILQDVITQQTGQPLPQLQITTTDCWIQGDRAKLTAILGHLVQNAQDATAQVKNGWVNIGLVQSTNQAVITIADNGCGMDQQFIAERLFKPFDTTKGNAGMGIGAYEAREYVLAQNGTLQVESAPGLGSKFTVIFGLN